MLKASSKNYTHNYQWKSLKIIYKVCLQVPPLGEETAVSSAGHQSTYLWALKLKNKQKTQLLHLEITLRTSSDICAISSIPETDRMRDQYIKVSQHSTLENSSLAICYLGEMTSRITCTIYCRPLFFFLYFFFFWPNSHGCICVKLNVYVYNTILLIVAILSQC